MKQVTRLELSDIDIKGNPMHSMLASGLTACLFVLTSPRKEGEDSTAHGTRMLTAGVMCFLNWMEEAGYTVTKKEEIPQAFTQDFIKNDEV